VDDRLAIEQLARWWHAASQEARFQKIREAIHGDPQAPSLKALKLAIILAEIEDGQVEEG